MLFGCTDSGRSSTSTKGLDAPTAITQAASVSLNITNRGNIQRTGEYTSRGLPGAATLSWKYQSSRTVKSSPQVINGEVYVSSFDGYTHLLDAITGQERSRIEVNTGTESLSAKTLYYAEGDTLYAIDTTLGQHKWEYHADAVIHTSPTVVNSIVYFGTDSGHFYAVDAETGLKKWQVLAGDMIQPDPAYINNTIYFIASQRSSSAGDTVAYTGAVYAVDPSTGQIKWQFNPSRSLNSLMVTNDFVYCSSEGDAYTGASEVYALNPISGKEVWHYIPQPEAYSSLSIGTSRGVLYVGSEDGHLFAISAQTRQVLWERSLEGPMTEPSIAANTLYLGTGLSLVALDTSTGSQRWQFKTEDVVRTAPFISDSLIYFSDDSALVYALK